MRYSAGIVLCIVVLSGCAGKKKLTPLINRATVSDSCDIASVYKEQSFKETALSALRRYIDTQEDDATTIIQKLEARCVDISIPLASTPLERYFALTDHGDCCLAYNVPMSMQELNIFLQKEMERCGWQKMASYEQYEYILLYKKPAKMIIVSLRPQHKKAAHSIMVVIQMHNE